MYDRIYRRDVLSSAYQIARTNKGAAGVDGVTFDDIESRTGASDRALCGRLCGLGAGIRAAGICDYIESQIESWLGLELNRDKTKVFNLRRTGDSLDFLGLTFRYDQDLKGRRFRYLNVTPPAKALQAQREALREMISARQSHVPESHLIQRVNRQLRGWANFFSFGYPRKAKRAMNWYVRSRLIKHLHRRSQRPFRPPKGRSFSEDGLILSNCFL